MMEAAVIVFLVGIALLVLALAAYLVYIAVVLRRVIDTLGKVTFGVRAIAHRTEPISDLVANIRTDVTAVDVALGELLGEKPAREGT